MYYRRINRIKFVAHIHIVRVYDVVRRLSGPSQRRGSLRLRVCVPPREGGVRGCGRGGAVLFVEAFGCEHIVSERDFKYRFLIFF